MFGTHPRAQAHAYPAYSDPEIEEQVAAFRRQLVRKAHGVSEARFDQVVSDLTDRLSGMEATLAAKMDELVETVRAAIAAAVQEVRARADAERESAAAGVRELRERADAEEARAVERMRASSMPGASSLYETYGDNLSSREPKAGSTTGRGTSNLQIRSDPKVDTGAKEAGDIWCNFSSSVPIRNRSCAGPPVVFEPQRSGDVEVTRPSLFKKPTKPDFDVPGFSDFQGFGLAPCIGGSFGDTPGPVKGPAESGGDDGRKAALEKAEKMYGTGVVYTGAGAGGPEKGPAESGDGVAWKAGLDIAAETAEKMSGAGTGEGAGTGAGTSADDGSAPDATQISVEDLARRWTDTNGVSELLSVFQKVLGKSLS